MTTTTETAGRPVHLAPLTTAEVVALTTVVVMAHEGQHVARVTDRGVVMGTARSIGDRSGYYAGAGDDIRDQFLRVTLDSGLDTFWPVSELAGEVRAQTFVEYAR